MSHLRNGNEFQRRNGLDDFHEYKPFKRSNDMRKCDNCSTTSLNMNYPNIIPHQSISKLSQSMTSMSYNDGYPPQFRRSCPQQFPVSYHQNSHQFNPNGDMQSIMQQTTLNAYKNHRNENQFGHRQSKQSTYSQIPRTVSSTNFSQYMKNEVDIELSNHEGKDYCDNVPLYYYDDATCKYCPVEQMKVSSVFNENSNYDNVESSSEQTPCNQPNVAMETIENSNENGDVYEVEPNSK